MPLVRRKPSSKKTSKSKSSSSSKGLQYSDIVKAEGGVSTNRQTGAKTYSSSNSGSSSARANDSVVDSTGRIIKEASPTNPKDFTVPLSAPASVPGVPETPAILPPIKPPEQSIEDFTKMFQTPLASPQIPSGTSDYEFSGEQDFFTRTGMKDFSQVQTIKRGETPTSQYYRYDDKPAVFQKSAQPAVPAPAPPGITTFPVVVTSEAERAKMRKAEIERIKAELTGGMEAPETFSSVEEYERLRKEEGIVRDEEELSAIRDEYRQSQEELRQFKFRAGQGVSEQGRLGAISEAEANLGFRREGLAIREQAVIDRLNSKNSYIDMALKLGFQDYQVARSAYESNWSQNFQAIQLYNQELDDKKQDALTSFQTMTNLLSEAGLSALTPEMSSQMDSLALQAGLPAGVFQTALQGIAKKERIDNLKIVGNNIYMWTTDPSGTPQLKLVQTLPSSGEQTSDMVEYEYAKSQGFTGTFQQWVDRSSRFKNSSPGPGPGNDYPSTSKIKNWIEQNRSANPNTPYHNLWGDLVDQMLAEYPGINPTNYDKQFWEVLHPDGLKGYEADQAAKKKKRAA